MFGSNDNSRCIGFKHGETLDVRLRNSTIRIHQDFDLSKETKFSMRTLMLLSVFCVGVFGFGLTPNFFGYVLTTNYKAFSVFCVLVLLGQSFIAWFQYDLNRGKLKEYLHMQKQEIERLNRYYNSAAEEWKTFEASYNDKCSKLISGHDIENIDNWKNSIRPIYNQKFNEYKSAELELKEARKIKTDAEIVYKWINGKATFVLVGVALLLVFCACSFNNSVADEFFGETSGFQSISVNVQNFDTNCLLGSLDSALRTSLK